MTRSTRLIIGALVIVVALAFWLFYRGGGDNDRLSDGALDRFLDAQTDLER